MTEFLHQAHVAAVTLSACGILYLIMTITLANGKKVKVNPRNGR